MKTGWLAIAALALAACSRQPEEAALEVRLTALQEELTALPKPLAGPAGGTLGYASDLEREHPESAVKWVGVDLGALTLIDAVALVPGWMIQTDRTERSHGFPLQFRVETATNADFQNPRVVFESSADYPDPGRHPVWVDFPAHEARFVRVVATTLGANFFGLSELFVFSGERNLALGAPVIAKDSLRINQNWQNRFLTDGYTPLGMPTALTGKSAGGYRSAPLPTRDTPSWIEIDLDGSNRLVSITLVPAFFIPNLTDFAQMGQGFPAGFRLELADGDGPWRRVFEHDAETRFPFPNPGNLAWHLALDGEPASRVRLTATQHRFDPNTQSHRLALAEIQLFDEAGINVAERARVTVSHAEAGETGWAPPRVVDGLAPEGKLLPIRTWLQALDRRRLLVQEMATVEQAISLAASEREHQRALLAWALPVSLALVAIVLIGLLQRSRRRHAAALREQIAQDLHDEVGSTLGSISLFSSALAKRKALDEAGQQRLREVAEMAREASQTMRDLVWVVDQRSDTSGQLIQRLRETASRQLGDLPFSFDGPDHGRSLPVSPEQKRHLLLFLKEALHNVIRHAQASRVTIRVQHEASHWRLEIADDGCGFQVDDSPGSQLEKLRARAQRLHGQLEVASTPGAGTRLTLTVPQA